MNKLLKPTFGAISIGLMSYNENWKSYLLFGLGS